MSKTLCYTSATELARRIRRGNLSPVEVVDAHLDRIREKNDELNAYVNVLAEHARDRARDAERTVSRGDRTEPLHGVPIALKDLPTAAKAGVTTTSGSKVFANYVPEADTPIVERLEAAGAIVLGVTNTPEFGHKLTTDNPLFGPTSTPFAPGMNAGGSSGGAAAAVAAGMAPIAQGTDGGGSLRVPASCCGVVGVKPTFGRVAKSIRPDAFQHTPFGDLGPIARTVEDAALMLDVIAGHHADDPLALPDDGTSARESIKDDAYDLSIAYCPTLGDFPVTEGVRVVVDDLVDRLTSAGVEITRTDPEWKYSHAELADVWVTWAEVGFAEMAALFEADGLDIFQSNRDDLTPAVVDLIAAGSQYSAVDFKRTDVVRTAVYDAIESLFGEFDLLVTPTVAVPTVENDPEGETLGPAEIDGEPVDPLVGWGLTFPFNFTGHPAASIPAGRVDGVPVGIQIVGPRFGEDRVLAGATLVERECPWDHWYPR